MYNSIFNALSFFQNYTFAKERTKCDIQYITFTFDCSIFFALNLTTHIIVLYINNLLNKYHSYLPATNNNNISNIISFITSQY